MSLCFSFFIECDKWKSLYSCPICQRRHCLIEIHSGFVACRAVGLPDREDLQCFSNGLSALSVPMTPASLPCTGKPPKWSSCQCHPFCYNLPIIAFILSWGPAPTPSPLSLQWSNRVYFFLSQPFSFTWHTEAASSLPSYPEIQLIRGTRFKSVFDIWLDNTAQDRFQLDSQITMAFLEFCVTKPSKSEF